MNDVSSIIVENTQFAIFSSHTPPEDVMYFMAEHNVPYQILLGSYKGQREVSYMVPYNYLDMMVDANLTGVNDGQESYLHLKEARNNGREAIIKYFRPNEDGADELLIGTLRNVGKEEALQHESWSFNPLTKSWFVVIAPEAAEFNNDFRETVTA